MVYVSDFKFYIDKYEVTNQDYQECVSAGVCKDNKKYDNFNAPKQPVSDVDQYDARNYCRQWAGKRLPKEQEWQEAAQGLDGREHPWGIQYPTCQYAVMDDGGGVGCGKNRTWEVGSKPAGASPYGALDMFGNVDEWVEEEGVLRGGGYFNTSAYLRMSLSNTEGMRHMYYYFYDHGGFRCAFGENLPVPSLPQEVSPAAGQASPQGAQTFAPVQPPATPWTPGVYQVQESQRPGAKGGPMVAVPAGEFWMGCNDRVDQECGDDENPYHKVYMDAFYIDKYEVTQGDYDQCVQAGKCRDNKKYEGFTGTRQPVVGVDWNDAKSYCEWAGKRLPTEAQWEKAARGRDGRKYPWGNQKISCSLTNCSNCNKGKTLEVGGYPSGASPYGALDMMGNVWEWVADWYDKDYYSSSPERNPMGASSGTSRVSRGGSWLDPAGHFRTSLRVNFIVSDQVDYIGFRCVGD